MSNSTDGWEGRQPVAKPDPMDGSAGGGGTPLSARRFVRAEHGAGASPLMRWVLLGTAGWLERLIVRAQVPDPVPGEMNWRTDYPLADGLLASGRCEFVRYRTALSSPDYVEIDDLLGLSAEERQGRWLSEMPYVRSALLKRWSAWWLDRENQYR